MKGNSHSLENESTRFHVPSKNEYKHFIYTYKPVTPGLDLVSLIQKDNFEIITYKNAVYFGEFKKVRQGFGVLVAQESIFEGYFEDNQKYKGSEVTFDGKYTGKYNQKGLR